MRICKYLITFRDGSTVEIMGNSEQNAKNNFIIWRPDIPESAIASVTELRVLHDTAWGHD